MEKPRECHVTMISNERGANRVSHHFQIIDDDSSLLNFLTGEDELGKEQIILGDDSPLLEFLSGEDELRDDGKADF